MARSEPRHDQLVPRPLALGGLVTCGVRLTVTLTEPTCCWSLRHEWQQIQIWATAVSLTLPERPLIRGRSRGACCSSTARSWPVCRCRRWSASSATLPRHRHMLTVAARVPVVGVRNVAGAVLLGSSALPVIAVAVLLVSLRLLTRLIWQLLASLALPLLLKLRLLLLGAERLGSVHPLLEWSGKYR
ncbi:hypothetical protein BC831DRAFT_116583 [Entophlyctis helioformis]|nr:hypothetical protein BC831DRAFT_116583 [Entophlyctis helioformis]